MPFYSKQGEFSCILAVCEYECSRRVSFSGRKKLSIYWKIYGWNLIPLSVHFIQDLSLSRFISRSFWFIANPVFINPSASGKRDRSWGDQMIRVYGSRLQGIKVYSSRYSLLNLKPSQILKPHHHTDRCSERLPLVRSSHLKNPMFVSGMSSGLLYHFYTLFLLFR